MAGLAFTGSFVQNPHLPVRYHQLTPRKDSSLANKVSLRNKLVIGGDNLNVLLPMYADRLQYIYVDPSNNADNENWVCNDNVDSPMSMN
jgi:adenine-specific DNA-methyltransferase